MRILGKLRWGNAFRPKLEVGERRSLASCGILTPGVSFLSDVMSHMSVLHSSPVAVAKRREVVKVASRRFTRARRGTVCG